MRPGMVLMPGRRGSGVFVSISNESITDEQVSPTSATAYYELQSDGDIDSNQGALADWLNGSVTGSDYECRATLVTGTLSSGTTGSWLALSSDRRWTVTRASLGAKSCTITVEIRDAATQTLQDTAEISLTATVTV